MKMDMNNHERAEAIKRLQSELHGFGLGLKIYDSYRPQRASRLLLKTMMEKHGFQPYEKEW